ncbi:MAG TPA: phage portal protein [Acidobacteriaceae bacterium]|nr:phage portal protein [Acidobacteriaceae bacterium]
MNLRTQITNALHRLTRIDAGSNNADATKAARKTTALPAILSPYPGLRAGQNSTPKPTPANLRKFAETPVARRAINLVKDKIACMDWSVRLRRGYTSADVADAPARIHALRCALAEPNASDSFRTLFEQVLEDLLVGGMGAVEMESTGDDAQPFRLYPVDGATIEIDLNWNGDPTQPRYAQASGALGSRKLTPLRDDELMYLRLNPRTHTPFGLGRLEVAFETINQFLAANKYAGRLASNSVVQYALWLNEATPEQHDRLIRWWQDEIEGTGRVPILSCEQKPEVLRFAGGTDADLRLAWQEFLLRIIANAFDLPPMLLGLQADVNRSTAGELADEAFRSAIVPVARLLAEHISRDLFAKRLGWREFEFVFNDLESRDEMQELQIQTELLKAGVLTIDEVREMRGLPKLVAGVR